MTITLNIDDAKSSQLLSLIASFMQGQEGAEQAPTLQAVEAARPITNRAKPKAAAVKAEEPKEVETAPKTFGIPVLPEPVTYELRQQEAPEQPKAEEPKEVTGLTLEAVQALVVETCKANPDARTQLAAKLKELGSTGGVSLLDPSKYSEFVTYLKSL